MVISSPFKGFSDKSKLKRHVSSVHEGKRPHKCDICGACFTQKSHMDGHVATVHGKKSAENQIKGTLFFQKVLGVYYFRKHWVIEDFLGDKIPISIIISKFNI